MTIAPGSTAFSVATAGCNVNCKMCQNWEISQSRPEQIQAQDFDVARMRKSYVRNALKNAPEGYAPTAADIAFLAADTNSDAAAVEAILAALKEA